jgi:F0F1-type ATP synthase assembly protein I
MGEAWSYLSTLFSGVVVWGAIGYGLDKWFGTRPVLFVIGALVGNFAGIYLIYIKAFGPARGPGGAAPPGGKRDEEPHRAA